MKAKNVRNFSQSRIKYKGDKILKNSFIYNNRIFTTYWNDKKKYLDIKKSLRIVPARIEGYSQ